MVLVWSKALLQAYTHARKNKRNKPDVAEFEADLLNNILRLEKTIRDKSYHPEGGIVFITQNPVIREIFAGKFFDRVVHHLLFDLTNEWWDRRLDTDSYSCRKGKGVLYGVKRLQHQIRSASRNFAEEVFVTKMDLQGCFMGFDRKKLLEIAVWGAERQFSPGSWECEVACFLWEVILLDDPTTKVRKHKEYDELARQLPRSKSLFYQKKGRGIVIGNLTSQLISNIFLGQFDRFARFKLGLKYYGRYVDDFYVITKSREEGMRIKGEMEKFLCEELGATMHPRKWSVMNAKYGVTFLGVIIRHGELIPGRRLVGNFREAVRVWRVAGGVRLPFGSAESMSVMSYVGHMAHFRSYRIIVGALSGDSDYFLSHRT